MARELTKGSKVKEVLLGKPVWIELTEDRESSFYRKNNFTEVTVVFDSLALLLKETMATLDFLKEIKLSMEHLAKTKLKTYSLICFVDLSNKDKENIYQIVVNYTSSSVYEVGKGPMAITEPRVKLRVPGYVEKNRLLEALLSPAEGDLFNGKVCILTPEVCPVLATQGFTVNEGRSVIHAEVIPPIEGVAGLRWASLISLNENNAVDDYVKAAVLFTVQNERSSVNLIIRNDVLIVNIEKGIVRWLDDTCDTEFSHWAQSYVSDVAEGYYYNGVRKRN